MQDFLVLSFIVAAVHCGVNCAEDLLATAPPFLHADCPLSDDALHPVQLPNPEDCTKYYSCLQGHAYTELCPPPLHWSTLHYRCDYPEVAQCSDSLIKIAATTAVPPPTSTLTTPNNDILHETTAYLPYENNCNRFYRCEPLHCPNNQQWSVALRRCVAPLEAACVDSTLMTTASTPPAPTVESTTVVVTPATPATPATAATPPPTIATTATIATTPPTPSNPLETTTHDPNAAVNWLDSLCLNTTSNYIKHPQDCHKFIQCNGFAYLHTCPANLYWNSAVLACDRFCI